MNTVFNHEEKTDQYLCRFASIFVLVITYFFQSKEQYKTDGLVSTTYMTGTIPAYIDDSNFFVYRNGWMDMEMINMGSWLIFSKYTNNIILLETQSLLYAYWKKYNYIKNYFLMHIFFRMVTDANPELWEQVPAINHIDSHLLMQELPKHYDENRCQQIMRLTPIHKLTYKVETSKGATAEKLHCMSSMPTEI